MTGVYERIEAHVVAIGEFLEKAKRYRPLAADAERLYRDAARIASQVRRSSRERERNDDPESLARQLSAIVDTASATLADFLQGDRYRAIADGWARGDTDLAEPLVELFADVEPATPSGRLHLPLIAKRGEGVLEPEAAAEALARMAADGIEPQRGPGVGGDDEIHPIRLFESLVGIDAALVVIVAGEAIGAAAAPALRAAELGETLVYSRRLRVPFTVGLSAESPDDWLEVRAGGYPQYRQRCRELVTERGFIVEDLA